MAEQVIPHPTAKHHNNDREVLFNRLQAGLTELNLAFDSERINRLIGFIQLIAKWNKTYNLTAVRDINAMLSVHLLDSLSIAPYINGARVLDVGTGAGLPGIPLAICYPELEFCLLDSNAKKTRFIQQVLLELKLNNVTVIHERVENYQPKTGFDTVVTRAFAELAEIIRLTRHLVNPNGVLLAMKSQQLATELNPTIPDLTVIPLTVPGLNAQRNLVRIVIPTLTEAS